MRRFIAGLTVLGGIVALLALPLASTGQPPNLAEKLRSGVNKTVGGVNDTLARVREQERLRRLREAARRAAARTRLQRGAQGGAVGPRQAAPNPQGQGYVPPLHGNNPHGQGTPATLDLPPSQLRPLPNNPAGGNGEVAVVGRSRGEQNPNGTYRGVITIAAVGGNHVIAPVETNPGETETSAPLAPVLNQVCNQAGVCLTLLNATSTTTGSGSTNRFSAATAAVGGPTGISASAATSNGNISNDAFCQTAHGDSSVAEAAVGGFTADAIQSTSDSRQCKDGSQTQTNTSRVVNLREAGVAVPPLISAACANGVANTPAPLLPGLVPAICNADNSNAAQALAPYGVREGLTTFVLPVGGTALLKATTGASESRAFIRAQCSDGIDNDGDGRIDFPNDPDCTGPTDDSEAGAARRTRPDDGGDEAECEDGIDNDGDGRVDYPDDRGCTSRNDDSEENDGAGTAGAGGGGAGGADGAGRGGGGGGDRLAFTGTNLVLMLLIGSLVLLAGLRIRALTGRRGASRAQRAGMA